ncbi:hypothetical protein PNK_1037 [Candidatus Protochlamydia naegleriophila]|uniref:NAD(+)--protein-arginine ADP-ribosyltransferase n=1 Tax=Candidatus Protochlamydia naegleriophila TaxID=389348 RepID=A0A0U5ER98_9BACT|nr:hypothetical protein [Candidatus Protochlamydia naegleriophila]CUI16657.1 hypothetical protein PNK_1037 [Candidatus Protochlamydia naegleriophila]
MVLDMAYLSPHGLSAPITPTFLLTQPFREAKHNLALAFGGKEISWIQGAKHFMAGLILSIPLINSIALLAFRFFGESQRLFAQSNGRFPERGFEPSFCTNVPQARPNETSPPALSVREFAQDFLQQIFDELVGEQKERRFMVALQPEGYLTVRHHEQEMALSELLNHVDWRALEEKWGGCSQEELQSYLNRSLVFETIQAEGSSPFRMSEPFIRCYTTHGLYSWLNPLLRKGVLVEGRLPFATQETVKQVLQKNSEVVDRVAKELLFISMITAARLNALPHRYKAECRVIRMAHVPIDVFEEMEEGAEIVERGFMSASAPGGMFAGGGPCSEECSRVKFIIYSKNGKYVRSFSQLPENEVLFKPFTTFKVLQRTGSQAAGYRVELEEV